MGRTKTLVGAVFVGCASLTLALVVPAASADDFHSSVRGSGGNAFATVTVTAHNTGSGTAATGWFTATGDLAKVAAPTASLPLAGAGAFHFEGPVTCLDVRGNRAGLIYPITRASGDVGKYAKGMAVYVSIVDGGPGKPDKLGFVGPAPIGSLTACPPTVTFLTGTFGNVVVTDAK